ncbi:MAG: hypothetical protein GQ565_07940 [Candidatus Aegiribacteria sp.]|nr:hypothetical protein [Candidatus Aegiribacteria sp.]
MEKWKNKLKADPIPWLLESEPWTKLRTEIDILDTQISSLKIKNIKKEIINDSKIVHLIQETSDWLPVAPGRNNDPKLSYFKLRMLSDFGLSQKDKQINEIIRKTDTHKINKLFAVRGTPPERPKKGEKFQKPDPFADVWHVSPCNSPMITYSLLALGCNNSSVKNSVSEIADLWDTPQGWFCHYFFVNSQFKKLNAGCPMAGLMALEVFSQIPELKESKQSKNAFAPLEFHWKIKKSIYYFGRSNKFWTLKYPFVWYNALYLADVLTRFDFLKGHTLVQEIVDWIENSQDEKGRFKPTSMFMPYKSWSFGNKKEPSPWITFLCCRILKRWYSQ